MKKLLSLSVVIPNWNGKNLLEKHLRHVIDRVDGAQVIVVDDCSRDGSVDYVRREFSDVMLVCKEKNEGFAASVNAGVAVADGEIVILLNTDVEPDADFLKPLLAHFSDETVFAVGCMEKSYEGNAVTLRGRGVARWTKGFYIHSRGEVDKTDTAWVSGGSGAFRRALWEQLGGMDTIYNPFYWEDIDLSYRARKAGYRTVFEPKSVIHHYHEQGAIKSSFTKKDVEKIAARNQMIFIWKNATDPKLLLTHFFWLPIRLMQSLLSGNTILLSGYAKALMKLPRILRARRAHILPEVCRDTEL